MRARLFTIANVPVEISPWFALLALIAMRGDVVWGALWIVALTISLLVHEFGHALVARHFRLGPSVLLHGFGGLCEHSEAASDRDDALIVAAGPTAGLVLGILCLPLWLALPPVLPEAPWTTYLELFLANMVFINIGWSFVNLLPVWPLDGGQLFRLGLTQVLLPRQAERVTHITALVLLVAAGVGFGFGLFPWGGTILVFLVALGAWMNVRALRGEVRSGAFRPKSREAVRLLKEAKEAYGRGDWREAARLGHLIRQEQNVSRNILQDTWGILGSATARLGDLEDAAHYLSRAKDSRDVLEAKVEVFYGLAMDKELREVLDSPAFQKLVPEERRREIVEVVSSPAAP